MKRLLITQDFPADTVEAARAHFEVTNRAGKPLTVEEARAALAEHDAILCTLGDGFTAEAFDGEVRAGAIANFGVGYNHIDVEAARAAGVVVSNTPGAVTDATADVGMTLMLMAARRAGEAERIVRAGDWTGWGATQFLGTHLTGKTLGVVGMGRIGQAVAKRAHHGFDMPVIFHNRSDKDHDHAEQVADLATLMSRADVVVVCVPGGAETRRLIDAEALSHLRDGAIFVNISRGDTVDEAALIAELQSGRISAGLDVYENEPQVPEALRALENVVLLPHIGTAALEVREAMGRMAVENLAAWGRGETPPNAVN